MFKTSILGILILPLIAILICSGYLQAVRQNPEPDLPVPADQSSATETEEAQTAQPDSSPDAVQPAVIDISAEPGDRIRLADVIPPEYARDAGISYRSSDESVAVIDDSGFLVAVRPGEATVAAANTEKPLSVRVAVSAPPGFQLEADYCRLAPGETARMEYRTTGGVAGVPAWTSSCDAVVAAREDGTLSAAAEGTAWVSATLGEFKDSMAVWVTDSCPYPPLGEVPEPRFVEDAGVFRNPEAENTGEATLFLTGDLMALSAQQQAARIGETYNFNSSFELVRPIFAQGDFVMGNLETCLSYSNPYTAQVKTVQGNPNCNAPATFLDALRYAGYDAVATANNHCGDAGFTGVCETLQMLDSYQLAHTGTFSRSRQPRFLMAEVNGIRIAFLSYTEIINTKGGNLAISEEDQTLVFNRYTEERLISDIAAARQAGAEYIVVYNHWGSENTHAVTDGQREHAQQMADAGVDFIAGSHSHCLQPAALITAADGRQVPCIFSMGNFVSSMGRDINNDTVMLKLDLKRENGEIVLAQAGYIPCRVFPEYEGGHHVIVPVSAELNGGRDTAALAAAGKRISEVMGGNVVFTEIASLP